MQYDGVQQRGPGRNVDGDGNDALEGVPEKVDFGVVQIVVGGDGRRRQPPGGGGEEVRRGHVRWNLRLEPVAAAAASMDTSYA